MPIVAIRTRAPLATFALIACLVACGDDPVAIDEIPADSKLSELDSAEMDGVCAWGKGVAQQKLPPGTNCHGTPIMFSGCMKVPATCTATVAQWRICMPNLLDRFAQDPCQVLDFAFSPGAFADFIEATPGCQGLGPCGTAMR